MKVVDGIDALQRAGAYGGGGGTDVKLVVPHVKLFLFTATTTRQRSFGDNRRKHTTQSRGINRSSDDFLCPCLSSALCCLRFDCLDTSEGVVSYLCGELVVQGADAVPVQSQDKKTQAHCLQLRPEGSGACPTCLLAIKRVAWIVGTTLAITRNQTQSSVVFSPRSP